MWLLDSLQNLVSGLGTAKDKAAATVFASQWLSQHEIENAYRSDWIARKIIDIPPFDETREWRDWQAESDQIEKLEAEEKRLDIPRKVARARRLARLYGGAALLLGDGAIDPAQALNIESIGLGGLKYVVALSCYEITAGEIDRDPISPGFGGPRYYDLAATDRAATRIHPSRVIRFIGSELPSYMTVSGSWGDSILQIVADAVKDAGLACATGAQLLHEAKVDVINVPELTQNVGNAEYRARMLQRFGMANTAKSTANMLLLDGAETWNRVQSNFAGIPDVIKTYLQVAAGAADIPATRLLGVSPQGMNSTGESDTRNYYDRISADQEMTLRPTLAPLDEALIRSATGKRDKDIYYEWAPLWQLSETEKATIAKTKAETSAAYITAGIFPAEVMTEIVANQVTEDGTYPGIEGALENYKPEPVDEEAEAALLAGDPDAGGGPNARIPFVQDGKRKGRAPKKGRSGFNPGQPRGAKGRWVSTGSKLEAALQAGGRGRANHATIAKVRGASRLGQQIGEDVRGFKHAVSNQAVAHTLKKHGNAKTEAARGQIAVTRSDFRKLPRIIREGNFHPAKQREFGPRRVKIVANIGGVEHHYVGEVRRGKRRIDMISMWKK